MKPVEVDLGSTAHEAMLALYDIAKGDPEQSESMGNMAMGGMPGEFGKGGSKRRIEGHHLVAGFPSSRSTM